MVDRQFCGLLLCGFSTSRGTLRKGQKFWIFQRPNWAVGYVGLARLLEALLEDLLLGVLRLSKSRAGIDFTFYHANYMHSTRVDTGIRVKIGLGVGGNALLPVDRAQFCKAMIQLFHLGYF
jgi:hypothetical protein